jgi:hypothetical protein
VKETHPEVFVVSSQDRDFILISKKRLPNTHIRIYRPANVVEVDFDRKDDNDWFFSYYCLESSLVCRATIADPSYFPKLEKAMKDAQVI